MTDQNEALKQDMITAVYDAAKQAALAADKLKDAIYFQLPPVPGGPEPPEAVRRIREVADFLTAPLFNNRADAENFIGNRPFFLLAQGGANR